MPNRLDLPPVRLQATTALDLEIIYTFVCLLEETALDFTAFQRIFLENLNSADWKLFNVWNGSKVVGYCSLHFKRSLHHTAEIAELEEFIIAENERKKGIGKQVILALIEICRRREVLQLEVSTHKRRAQALNFYLAAGFTNSHQKLVQNI